MSRPLPGIRTVAVMCAHGLGDFMFALPALEALRAAYPTAAITLLGKTWQAHFLRGRPAPVDEVFVLPDLPGLTVAEGADWDRQVARMAVRNLRERGFDLALQLFGGGRFSNPFIASLGAGLTAGLQAAEARPLDLNVPYRYFQTEVFRLLEVVALVGASPVTMEPDLRCTAADHLEAAAVLETMPAPGLRAGRLVVLHPSAGDRRRRWPVKHFARVARELADQGHLVVITGSVDDRPLTSAVAASAGGRVGGRADGRADGRVGDLGGRLTLGGLAGLLRRASLVVANDSGPLHLARAVGTATVGIFWCGNLITAGPLERSRHRPLCSWRLECPVCGMNCITGHCEHDASFVAEVSVAEVLDESVSLLAAAPDGSPELPAEVVDEGFSLPAAERGPSPRRTGAPAGCLRQR